MFAALALALSALGVYGVLAYAVAQRARDIGIRGAQGASPASLMRMVLTNGLRLTACGLAAGVVGARVVTRLLSSVLFGIGARDPLTMVLAGAVLFAVLMLACYVPARRAARLDRIVVLRSS